MTAFDDRLLLYLMREHADLLDHDEDPAAERPTCSLPARSRRTRRSWLMMVAGVGLPGVAVIFVLTVVAFGGKVAYAVTTNSDGTVTITLREILGVSGLNQQLSSLGVRAKAFEMDPTCGSSITEVDWTDLYPRVVTDNGPTPTGEPARVTIAPSAIPSDKTLILAARGASSTGSEDAEIAVRLMLIEGPPPPCVGMVLRDPSPPPPGVGQRLTIPTRP